jgi:hypothetical protein
MKKLMLSILLIITCTAQAEKTDLQLSGHQGVHYFFTLSPPWVDDPEYIRNVFQNFCADKPICVTHIWKKGEAAPKRLPFTDKEIELELATFQHNSNTGRNELLWNCKRFKNRKLNNCF